MMACGSGSGGSGSGSGGSGSGGSGSGGSGTGGSGALAGCVDNADCAPDEFCRTAPGDCGGIGSCEPYPFGCAFIYLPVCGCDGIDYSNECIARISGISVDTNGVCPP